MSKCSRTSEQAEHLLCFTLFCCNPRTRQRQIQDFSVNKKNTNQQQFSLSSMTLNVSAATIHNEHFSFYEKSTCCAGSVIFGSCHFHDAKNILKNIKPQTKKIQSKHTQRYTCKQRKYALRLRLSHMKSQQSLINSAVP